MNQTMTYKEAIKEITKHPKMNYKLGAHVVTPLDTIDFILQNEVAYFHFEDINATLIGLSVTLPTDHLNRPLSFVEMVTAVSGCKIRHYRIGDTVYGPLEALEFISFYSKGRFSIKPYSPDTHMIIFLKP